MLKPALSALSLILLVPASLVSAQPVAGSGVFAYARLGQSAVFADGTRSAPAIGFGVRGEFERLAIDASFLNLTLSYDPQDPAGEMAVGSMFRLQALRFLSPESERSIYVGGGVGWGHVSVGRGYRSDRGGTSWDGSGLQGELTIGGEVARASAIRLFVQADASLPFFAARSSLYVYPQPGSVIDAGHENRYVPAVVVSAGVGWRHHR